MLELERSRIVIVGLGYVGLPLAVEFGKAFPTIGFDINAARIAELQRGEDSTLEVEPHELAAATQLSFTDSAEALRGCNVYVVTVPTPVRISAETATSPAVWCASGRSCPASTTRPEASMVRTGAYAKPASGCASKSADTRAR